MFKNGQTKKVKPKKFSLRIFFKFAPITLFGWSKGMDQIAEKYNSEFDGWQIAIK